MRSNTNAVKDIHDTSYPLVCREVNTKPMGYTMFNRYLGVLGEKNLIKLGKGQEGKSVFNTITLTTDKKLIGEEFEKRKMMMLRHH